MDKYPSYLQEEPDNTYLKQLADSDRPLRISLTNDFAFKKTFRNKKALTGLLSGLLDIPTVDIAALEFPDTFEHGEYPDDHEVYSSKLSLRVLYLKKLKYATEQDKKTDVYRWARLISAHDWEMLKEMAGVDEYMNAAVEEMEKINADKNLRYQYLMREKAANDAVTLRNYYTNEGLEKGLKKGLKKVH